MPRILVVEDSRTQAEELRFVLESEGFAVRVVLDAEQALDLLRASTFDLIISDVVMPGLSGYDLCRRLKDDAASRHTPVLLLTTLGDPEAIIRGLECGADNFVT